MLIFTILGDLTSCASLMLDEEDIIGRIKRGDKALLDVVYEEYRSPFLQWAKTNYSLDKDHAVEVFQVSVVILYENIMSGKLTDLKSSLKTYLFAIGKNKAREEYRKKIKFQELQDYHRKEVEDDDVSELKETQLKLIAKEMKTLGQPCEKILSLYYYDKKSMEDIAEQMNYKNAATAKNQKYKCLQRLKKLVQAKAA